MSKFLGSPKLLAALAVVVVIFIVSVAGGALGNEFGGGFLGSPIAHIQLPAESITADALFLDFKITNTMIATWLTILVLAAVAFLVGRRIGEVPSRLQSLLEVVFEFFLNLTESVAGREKGRRFFPLVMTIFLFIVTANWLGILPGFSTIGRVETAEEIVHHAVEEVEKENKKDSEKAPKEVDLSEIKLQVFDGDGAVGIIPFGSMDGQITALGLYELKTVVEELTDPQRQILLADAQKIQKSADVGHKIAVERETPDLVAGKLDGKPVLDPGELDGKRPGILVPFLRGANTDVNTTLAIALIAMFMVHFWALRALGLWGHLSKFINLREGPIGFFVGVLEGISEVARIISFTFRLFGNIFAGEVLLVALAFLLPLIGIIPFLGLELFVGLIQAFIFSMLTLLFAAMATVGHGAEQH